MMIEPIPYVVAGCISRGGIPKIPQHSVFINVRGLAGDGHDHEKHYHIHQAVSIQDFEILEDLNQEGFNLSCGIIGENLTVRQLNVQSLPVGTILKFSGGVILELTKERKPCYVLDSIDPQLKEAIVGRCGFYAKVWREGLIKPGETINVFAPVLYAAMK